MYLKHGEAILSSLEETYWGVCVRWRGRWGVGYRIQCNVDVGQYFLTQSCCLGVSGGGGLRGGRTLLLDSRGFLVKAAILL